MPYAFLLLILNLQNQNPIQQLDSLIYLPCLYQSDSSCLPPENYGVVNITSNGARLVWTDVPLATQYRIKLIKPFDIISDTLLEKSFRYDLSALQSETAYKVQITSICGDKTSIPTDWIEWQTRALPECQRPLNLNVPWTTDSSARVDWMPTPGASGYLLFFREGNSVHWDSIFTITTGTTLKKLNASKSYQISVKAKCGSRQSKMSSMISFNTPTRRVCEKPSLPKLYELNKSEAIWCWSKPKHTTGFQVLDRLSDESGWRTWNTNDTVIVIPIRVPGKAIEMKLRSNCNNVISEFTSIVRSNTLTIHDNTDVHEQNDFPLSASLIFPPLNIKGNLIEVKDEDWFRFETPACGSIFQFIVSNAPDNLELKAMDDSFQPVLLHRMTSKSGNCYWKGAFLSGIHYLRVSRRIDTAAIRLSHQPIETEAIDDLASVFNVQSTSILGHDRINSWDTLIFTISYTGKAAIYLKNLHVHNNDNGENYTAELIKSSSVESDIPNLSSNATSGLSDLQNLIQQGETFGIKMVAPSRSFVRIGNDILTPITLHLEKIELSRNNNYHLKIEQMDSDEKTE